MLYFLDTEFLDDGETIMPISLALVREDGAHLYVEFPFDQEKARSHDFVREHVLPHLRRPKSWFGRESKGKLWWDMECRGEHASGHGSAFRELVAVFLDGDPAPEFWAFYADYDWILFCQRYGPMVDLPERFPKFCMDLQQWYVQLGRPEGVKPPDPEGEHDALTDARWNLLFHARLASYVERLQQPATSVDGVALAPGQILVHPEADPHRVGGIYKADSEVSLAPEAGARPAVGGGAEEPVTAGSPPSDLPPETSSGASQSS